MCYDYNGGSMKVVDNKYVYDYEKYDQEFETLKIIQPNQTRLVLCNSADGLDIRLISTTNTNASFYFNKNSILFPAVDQVLKNENKKMFIDVVFGDKALFLARAKDGIAVRMESVSTDLENKYFMTLKRDTLAKVFKILEEKATEEKYKKSHQKKKVPVNTFN